MRAKQAPSVTELSDLLWTAEQLLTDLLAADCLVAAASVSEAVENLRPRVREETTNGRN